MLMLRIAVTALAASAQALHRPKPARNHRELINRASDLGIKIATASDDAMCLGLENNKACNHQAVVLQPCADDKTARWRLRNGALKTGKNMCLDVPDGRNVNGQPLQIYRCFAGNDNQQWVSQNNHLVWRGSNKSVDVTDGCLSEGTPLQLWDTFAENTNQAFELDRLGSDGASSTATSHAAAITQTLVLEPAPTTTAKSTAPAISTPAPNAVPTDAGSYAGYSFISFDAFMALHPVLNPLRQDILDAAASANIGLPPILLAAQALQESSGNPNVGNGGLGQFAPGTWQQFGQGDINNGRDNLFAMAKYLKYLLGISQGNLDEALRIYSGSLSFYQGDIRRWLMGDFVYGPGT